MAVSKEKKPKRKRASFSPLKTNHVADDVKKEETKEEIKKDVFAQPEATDDKPEETKPEEETKAPEEESTPEESTDTKDTTPLMVVEEANEEKKESAKVLEIPEEEPEAEPVATEEVASEEESESEPKSEPEKEAESKSAIADFAPLESQDGTDIDQIEKSSKKNIVILILVAVVSFLLGLGVAFGVGTLVVRQQGGNKTTEPTPLPDISPEPTPTPEPEVSRSDVTLKILNGSGVKGAAAKAQDFFEGLGYTVDSIGNADASDYETSELSVKKDTDQAIIQRLLDDIGDTYSMLDPTTDLDADADVTAQFIIGKE